MYVITGDKGQSFSMLPGVTKPGEPRPIMKARYPTDPLNNLKTPEQVYKLIQVDFPQLDVDCFDRASVEGFCESRGSVFPEAKWARRACHVVETGGVMLLGDALHAFPPDLGQGVNAGFVDVQRLLALWPSDIKSSSQVRECLEAFEASQLREAESICRLIPIGFPYQYRQPASCAKTIFMSGFLTRIICFKLLPSLFYPPVVFAVQDYPPKKYSDILREHHLNTRTLAILASAAVAGVVMLQRGLRRL
eukprot:gnl/TRDRNA2_/TRDRNA2_133706_c2_seq1.p1 gnl/TRDRNA2_/TRDRNA2_133706_c2~~gnl/TRDRNA2_/TRDRNA2_133706_c2_seq1.p1  ORF type:complete len:249 (+),score=30.54 gnl/TRDRNA2_/TRDRNA2_133706_c2_seq1:3-749(+)